jgi:hypothetical protein
MPVHLENVNQSIHLEPLAAQNYSGDAAIIQAQEGKRVLHGSKHTSKEGRKTDDCSYNYFARMQKNASYESPSIAIHTVEKMNSKDAFFSVICSSGKLFLRYVKKHGEMMENEVIFTRQEKARIAYWMNLKQAFEDRLKILKETSGQAPKSPLS